MARATAVLERAADAVTESKMVTFYSWIESYPQAVPTSETIRVSGGQRQKDPTSGAILALEYKEVRFNMGILHTNDPETIKVLRGMIAKGASMTTDKDVYLSKIMKPEELSRRTSRVNAELKGQLSDALAENEKANARIAELMAQLAKKGS